MSDDVTRPDEPSTAIGSMSRRTFVRYVGLAGLLAACQPAAPQSGSGAATAAASTPAAQPSVKEVLIGGVHPLTGGSAFDGTATDQGARVAVDEINDAGGIKSLGGAKIRYESADTQSKVDVGTAETERLIRQGVTALIGYQSAVVLAMTQVAEREKVPFVISLAVADEILGRGFKYAFRTGGSATIAATQTIQYLKDVSKAKNVAVRRLAILHNDNLFAVGIGKLLDEIGRKEGFEIATKIQYPLASTDLTNEVQRLRSANPDVIFVSSFYADGLLAARTIANLKVDAKAVWGSLNGGFSQPKFAQELGKSAEFIMDNNWATNERSDAGKKLAAAVAKKFPNDPYNFNHLYGYVCIKTVADGLERARSADRDKLRDALAQTKLPFSESSQKGPIEFDATGQNTNAVSSLLQIQNGKVVTVWPQDSAAAQPTFPVPPWAQRS